jgi:5,10-methylenetetrahydromethanopterin reductase
MALGQRAMRWRDVAAYVHTLRGEQVLWEGKPIQMLHTPGFAPPRPLEVPFLIAAGGPKGIAVAREVGDGVAGAMPIGGFAWSVAFAFGTVLAEGEEADAKRPLAAAGHGASLMLHYGAEYGLLDTLLPEQGHQWLSAYEEVPTESRHLAMHYGHLVLVNERNRPYVAGALLTQLGLARSAAGWQERRAGFGATRTEIEAYAAQGYDACTTFLWPMNRRSRRGPIPRPAIPRRLRGSCRPILRAITTSAQCSASFFTLTFSRLTIFVMRK